MASRKPYVEDTVDAPNDSGSDQVVNEKTGNAVRSASIDVDQVHELAEKLGDRVDGLAPENDIEFVMDKVQTLTVDECRQLLSDLLEEHKYDYNFTATKRHQLEGLLLGPQDNQTTDEWELKLKTETAINQFYSPYPEVRAVTTPDDDPTMSCETIRAHCLGLFWACVAQFVNSLFNSRFPQIILQSQVMQVLLYPCGMFLALVLPDWGFNLRGQRISLNPGPWTYKEQMLSTLMVNVSVTSAYVFWNIQTQTVYYHETWLTPGYKILLLLSTQCMGLGFAGLLRRFAVYPKEAIWPSVLPTVALNRALLVPSKRENIHGWTISRYTFFWIVFGCMFCYYWLPDYLFPALSFFAWMTWIKPNNFNLATVTGSQFGLGFNPISSFDWNIFSAYWYPLAFPFFTFVQQYIGMMIGGLAILALYFTNTKWTGYLPINSSGIYDNTGLDYNITRVVADGVLNEAAYQAYSPAFYSAGNLVVYAAFFAFYPLTMVFIILDSWRPLSKAFREAGRSAFLQIKRIFTEFGAAVGSLVTGHFKDCGRHLAAMMDDQTSVYDGFDNVLTNIMRKYPEVPDWWYLAIVLVSFIFSIILLTQFPDQATPVWTIFFVIGLNLVFLIPMTYLYAISGNTEGLNVLTELVVGYALPGHPNALMFVKAFGYNLNGQADYFVSDQKMALYAKVPPRAMYRGQLLSAVVTCFVAYGVVQFVDNDIQGICTPDQPANFSCNYGSLVYFSASVIWGAIGPKRIFDQIYPEMKYAFLLGFLLAIAWWAGKHFGTHVRGWFRNHTPSFIFKPLNMFFFGPLSWLRDVHPALILNGMIYWAPLNLTFFTSGLYMSFGFMYYIRRYKTAWFEKYNYVLSAGLTGGVAFAAVIIFFAVQYHPKPISWWGTNVVATGVDGYAGQAAWITTLPESGKFGPEKWH